MVKFLRKIFQKDEVQRIDDNLEDAFYRVGKDIDLMRQWIIHLSSKSEGIHNSHNNHIDVTKKEITNLNGWIEYMRRDMDLIKKTTKEMSHYLLAVHKSHKETIEKIMEIEKRVEGHSRTIKERTTGQERTEEKDINQGQRVQLRTEEGHKEVKQITAPNTIKIVDKKAMTPAQEELLKLLYEADRPLDYPNIARILRKKEKSIRNLIYEIREKGIKVLDRHIGDRKKGFYLAEEERIKISGR